MLDNIICGFNRQFVWSEILLNVWYMVKGKFRANTVIKRMEAEETVEWQQKPSVRKQFKNLLTFFLTSVLNFTANPSSPASRTTDSSPRSTTTALIGHLGGPTSDFATWSICDCSKLFWHLVGR